MRLISTWHSGDRPQTHPHCMNTPDGHGGQPALPKVTVLVEATGPPVLNDDAAVILLRILMRATAGTEKRTDDHACPKSRAVAS